MMTATPPETIVHAASTDVVGNSPEDFEQVVAGRLRGVVHKRLAAALGNLDRLDDTLEQCPREVLRKAGGQGVTARCDFPTGPIFLKKYAPGNLERRLRDIFGVGRAMREWESNCSAHRAGVRTATFVAALSQKHTFGSTHYVLTLPAPGLSISKRLRVPGIEPAEQRDVMMRFGKFARYCHEKGFWHAHFQIKHVFVDPDWNFTVIDLERSRVDAAISSSAKERNLRQVKRSLRPIHLEKMFDVFMAGYQG